MNAEVGGGAMIGDPGHHYPVETLQQGTRRLLPAQARRILDLGGGKGGNGVAVKGLTGAGFVCVADISEEAIAGSAPGVDASAVCNLERDEDVAALFDQHGPFDLILCLDVLEHLVDPWKAVARLHAHMPMGGRLLVSVPNVQHYRAVLGTLRGSWRYRQDGLFDRTHLRWFTGATAVDLVTGTGLKLRGTGKAYGSSRKQALADRLSLGIFSSYLTLQHQLLVEKVDATVRDPGFCGSASATA